MARAIGPLIAGGGELFRQAVIAAGGDQGGDASLVVGELRRRAIVAAAKGFAPTQAFEILTVTGADAGLDGGGGRGDAARPQDLEMIGGLAHRTASTAPMRRSTAGVPIGKAVGEEP
jgi:hypothetical protein